MTDEEKKYTEKNILGRLQPSIIKEITASAVDKIFDELSDKEEETGEVSDKEEDMNILLDRIQNAGEDELLSFLE